ncbi:MAG: D-2-hydroxyacid dehydrogenase [Deltaproteobacteria bacterium]|nr:D-2-hydroxyacid dehydrogenase [Deltaproteobacteria bacterium]
MTVAPKIVFLDAATFGDMSLAQFTDRWPCTVHQVTQATETAARITGHNIAVTNKVAFDKTILNSPAAEELKLIAVAATGTDVIDKDAATKRGVKVCNVPGYAAQAVGQFTIALLLELASRIGSNSADVKAGAWQSSPVYTLLTYPQVELHGKKLGIIGYGNIGKTVAKIAGALGMEILVGARPGGSAPPSDRVPLDRLFREADVITLHCPLTPQTKNLINGQTLASMKSTAFLINTARGALVDEAALIETLRHKRIAGAAVDVITQEPPPADHPMIVAARELSNLMVTPHTAWSAREARERLLSEVKENIAAFLAGQHRNRVA